MIIDDKYATPIVIALLVIILLGSAILTTVFVIIFIKKKQKEYVEETSLRIKQLKEINQEYKNQFGSISNCDFEAPISFKYKNTFDNFCSSEVKAQKFVLDYYEQCLKRTIYILKNVAINALYEREIKRIKSTTSESIKLKYLLSYGKYVEIENKLFLKKIIKAPERFALIIVARYSSAKGYSNYQYKIDCGMDWLQSTFLKYKHVDMYMEAHKAIMAGVRQQRKTITEPIVNSNQTSGIKKPNSTDSYYVDLLDNSYEDIVQHLLNKSGAVPGDYFLTETCKSKNTKISRMKEGLFVHHIDEDKAILLSTDKFAIKNPYKYQKADRLVYCDILEHLILHIKIAEEPRNANANENELPGIGGAVNFICAQINDCYSDYVFKQERMIIIREMIKDKFDDYIYILKYLYRIILTRPEYRNLITKNELCCGMAVGIVQRVYKALS